MATEAKKPDLKVVEEAAKAPSEKKAKDWLGLIVLVLVVINVGVVGAMGFFMSKMWGHIRILQSVVEKPEPAPVVVDQHGAIGKDLEPAKIGVLFPMESFLVNIQSEQGTKFLQTQMEFELADPSIEEELSRKKAAVRDAVIVLLSSRTYQQLRQADGLKDLRREIISSVNHLLTSGKVREVYFTQFHFN